LSYFNRVEAENPIEYRAAGRVMAGIWIAALDLTSPLTRLFAAPPRAGELREASFRGKTVVILFQRGRKA
jgi:hypothetical protein